ncbi:pyrroline-5-carboxylate reductase [Lichtheimia corymbifera JMRC:FSU:9682]|uniref:Pyrroline-5-carboxylate reductase n=1 Tax=Lichtheimia corymbifera JMRC:FSU:9682 TaxID=1263082 RepID=A0A068RRI2_9FUNG|nr:pyrroline-5-carboxylate reductase [Lichtheimia corymbifera JMRC:FSU:9682]
MINSQNPAVQRLESVTNHINMVSASNQRPVISFIGGGNMAEAILGGLHSSGHPGSRLRYSEPLDTRRQYMQSKYPELVSSETNEAAVDGADVVVLAVKPQVLRSVVTSLAPSLLRNPSVLIISVAAGINTEDIATWLNASSDTVSIVRCMPNTPALIGEGAMGLYANPSVTQEQRNITESIMQSIAKQVSWVQKEALIESVTGISGSGPAYFFLIMEAMQNAGVAAGLTLEDAKALTLQTCVGAARMAQESEDDLATLRRKVTSPRGTTEAAIKSLEGNNIREIMKEAVFAAERRGHQLAEEMRQ